jgi:hypothetical protein
MLSSMGSSKLDIMDRASQQGHGSCTGSRQRHNPTPEKPHTSLQVDTGPCFIKKNARHG